MGMDIRSGNRSQLCQISVFLLSNEIKALTALTALDGRLSPSIGHENSPKRELKII